MASSLLVGVDWALRAAGLAACGGALYTYLRIRSALNRCCDSAAANAKLPPDAYSGKVIWITGASSGIGEELARQLAAQGAKLILSARRADKLEQLAADLRSASGNSCEVHVLALDLKDIPSLEATAKKALAIFGVVDVLINNGGYTSRALAFLTPSIQTDIDMMEVNFLSAVALTKALLPSMHERKSGHIINIVSLAGKYGVPLRTLYCGAKHAMIGWFDAFRAEEDAFKTGVSVTNICPGSVRTDVARNAVTGDGSLRGYSDPNIDSGLSVVFVCGRILAAAYCGLPEVWIAKGSELQAAYASQYMPVVFKGKMKQQGLSLVSGTMGEEYVKDACAQLGQAQSKL